MSSCWLLVHPSFIHLLVSEGVFSEAVPENQQMKHLLFSQRPMCFLSSVSWSALNKVLISCLCSSAEATDSWACCVWATAGMRNACVCCRGTKKELLLRARPYRQMSDGGQQDHHCRLSVWGSAHWWIIDGDEGQLPSSFYSVQIDTYIMSECCRILHKASVLNWRPLSSSLCVCID